MWEIATHTLRRGGDVILDFGLWTRDERRQFAARAAELGAICKIDFDPVPLDELERRSAERNRHAGNHFAIPIAVLRDWASQFEAPDEEEQAGRFRP